MSKLAHSCQETMDQIEREAREAEDHGERTDPPSCPGCKADVAFGEPHKAGCDRK